jgi:hypothetical protein
MACWQACDPHPRCIEIATVIAAALIIMGANGAIHACGSASTIRNQHFLPVLTQTHSNQMYVFRK